MAKKSQSHSVHRCQRRKKKRALDFYGGKCITCGYSKCINALEFHHRNPDEKVVTPAYAIHSWSWERAKIELDKCDLLCANCHREEEYREVDTSSRARVMIVVTQLCGYCNEEFELPLRRQRRTKGGRNYCSTDCLGYASRRQPSAAHPTKAQLQQLLTTRSWVSIGKTFGVADNTVRKWARNYSIAA